MRYPLIIALFFLFSPSIAQKKDVYVDKKGVMRWGDTRKEVMGFGVNYTVPFAHAYRSAKKLGVDHKQAIDNDVYHFSRLGFDLYRVHVWDTEISDSLGNLIENEHLDLYDYLLSKLGEYDINYVITPIAFWGNGWPEPDQPTPGFSHKYGKQDCLTNPDAIKAQENYLEQFVNHVNKYTGVAYKDDPRAIAFEVSNEPHHAGNPDQIKDYITRMVKAVKSTGTRKPVFYNVSHSIQFAETYFASNIYGGTFQWYPTGLTYGREVPGNLLPNVDRYYIPFDDVIRKSRGAKLVYEFDAADVGRSYIYPAMARSFREAGIQIATHFSYDPTFLSYANTEYNTHYMNLAYTPGKALSLMIAGKVFHEMPMYKSYGRYPNNTTFGNISISYENDLAEYVSEDTFIYTNSTNRTVDQNAIRHIAGTGSSALAGYEGSGAYFIDRIKEGIWRLEVMPDVLWTGNPFGRNSLNRKIADIQWSTHTMYFNPTDLGSFYRIEAVNEGNTWKTDAEEGYFQMQPGTYLLFRGEEHGIDPDDLFGNSPISSFYAPRSTLQETLLIHSPMKEAASGKFIPVEAQLLSPDPIQLVQLVLRRGWDTEIIDMEFTGQNTYHAIIPEELTEPGLINYSFRVMHQDWSTISFPGGVKGKPEAWDYNNPHSYSIKLVPSESPVYLFNAHTDSDKLIHQWNQGNRLVALPEPDRSEYYVNLPNLERSHNDYSIRSSFVNELKGRLATLGDKKELVIKGSSLNDKPCRIRVGIVLADGSTYGTDLILNPEKGEYTTPISGFQLLKTVTLPRPYPTFMDYYTHSEYEEKFNLSDAESLVISIGPGIPESEFSKAHGVAIEMVILR